MYIESSSDLVLLVNHDLSLMQLYDRSMCNLLIIKLQDP